MKKNMKFGEIMYEPYMFKRDDGSFLIEFSEENSKFLISIGKDVDESGWSYVNLNCKMRHGDFPEDMIKCLKKFFEENE
jgi:hypothetical protein